MQDIDKFIEEARQPKHILKETDTYCMQDLKKASNAKVLTKYCEALGFTQDDFVLTLFIRYINGHTDSINNTIIFRCREQIQPSRWYYQKNEELPASIKFNPKLDAENILNKDSQGHVILRQKIKEMGIEKFSETFEIDQYKLKNTLYRRYRVTDGKQVFKSLPSFHFVRALKDIINPDLWYIFPEELE